MTLFSAAAQLLERDMPVEYRREWTQLIGAKPSVPETDFRSIVIFRIGPEWLALPTATVKQIAERTPIHRIPHRTGGIVRGIASVHGEVLLCVALDVLLGLPLATSRVTTDSPATHERLVICGNSSGQLAFAANEVYGVHRYSPRSLRDIPATVSKAAATYTLGILPWNDNRTVGCLDAELVAYALNKGLA